MLCVVPSVPFCGVTAVLCVLNTGHSIESWDVSRLQRRAASWVLQSCDGEACSPWEEMGHPETTGYQLTFSGGVPADPSAGSAAAPITAGAKGTEL